MSCDMGPSPKKSNDAPEDGLPNRSLENNGGGKSFKYDAIVLFVIVLLFRTASDNYQRSFGKR
jgi:hypothetical protein